MFKLKDILINEDNNVFYVNPIKNHFMYLAFNSEYNWDKIF